MNGSDLLKTSHRRQGLRLAGGVFAGFAILALILSWPLVTDLSSRLPGTATWAFDESTFAWNIWYFKHALVDLHTSPLHSELIWYPLGIDLILYTYNFFNALSALPLQVAVNLPFASNVTLLLATVLSGLGAYLLTYYVLRTTHIGDAAKRTTQHAICNVHYVRLAALLAGLIYAFASNRAVYAALGHYDMVTTQWLPFYALYLLKALREPRLKNAVLAGLFFALAALAEMIFASFLALLSLIIVLAMWRELKARGAALGRLALAGLVAALLWSPVLVPIAREFLRGDYALTGWGESVKLSTDLVGLVTPTELNPLFVRERHLDPAARWQAALRAVEEGKAAFSDINTVFLGWVTLALGLLGSWLGRRQLKGWIWSAVIFGVLCLGPLLQINGRYRFSLDNLLPEGVTFPLPFALLHFIPFVSANRAPNRNSVILMLALAVLAGYGAWRVNQRIGESANLEGDDSPLAIRYSSFAIRVVYLVACILAILILLEHLAIPLPTTDATIPAVYRQIAQEPGEFAIMQLPLGWRNSFGVLGSEQTQLQYFQTAHGKPIIGGNISRAPDFKMAYFARIPLFKAITDLEMYRDVAPELDAAARAQAAQLMALYNVRYFITTPPIPGRYPYQDTWQRTEAYALEVLPLEKPAVWEQDGYRVYRVRQPELAWPFRVDLGVPGVEPYLGQGWDVNPREQPYSATADWVTATAADLYLPLAQPRDVILRTSIAPLAYEGAPDQRMTVSFNGVTVLRDRPLAAGWQTVEVQVPAQATRRGLNRVRLQFAWAHSPRLVFPDPGSRAVIGGTGIVSPVNLDVHSFAEAFMTATDATGKTVDLSMGRRGYNVAVLDQRTGRLLDRQGFDTAANPYEAEALAAYLARVPRGRIVVLATKGNATDHLIPAAVAALRNIGSHVATTAELAGMAHALVGVQGAGAGTAAEEIAAGDAFLRVAGDFRVLAAAVDWVELE
ncbi:MAG: interleukin-like EMT inducer domain-containing protein [Anaerolineae bacterium]